MFSVSLASRIEIPTLPSRFRMRLRKAVLRQNLSRQVCGRADAYARTSLATSPSRGAGASEKPYKSRPSAAALSNRQSNTKGSAKAPHQFPPRNHIDGCSSLQLTKCRNPLLQRVNAEVAQTQSGLGNPSKFTGHCGNGLAMTVGLPRGAGTRNGVACQRKRRVERALMGNIGARSRPIRRQLLVANPSL